MTINPVNRLLTELRQYRRAREEGFFQRNVLEKNPYLESEYASRLQDAMDRFDSSKSLPLKEGTYDKEEATRFLNANLRSLPIFKAR